MGFLGGRLAILLVDDACRFRFLVALSYLKLPIFPLKAYVVRACQTTISYKIYLLLVAMKPTSEWMTKTISH